MLSVTPTVSHFFIAAKSVKQFMKCAQNMHIFNALTITMQSLDSKLCIVIVNTLKMCIFCAHFMNYFTLLGVLN